MFYKHLVFIFVSRSNFSPLLSQGRFKHKYSTAWNNFFDKDMLKPTNKRLKNAKRFGSLYVFEIFGIEENLGVSDV